MGGVLPYLIICPLVGIAGFVDAIAGGGGLISLPAYLIAGVPVHTAIGTNKLSSSMGTAVSTFRYAREGFIPGRQSLLCVVLALAGSAAGARLTLLIPERGFTLAMLVVLPVTAWYVLRSSGLQVEKAPFPFRKTLAISLPIALLAGAYDGFYGPGTGTFLFTGAAHMSLHAAAGVTKVINLTSNVTALAVFLWNGVPNLSLGLTAGCFGILGNYLGARLFSQRGARWTRPLIIVVLAIFFGKVCLSLL